MQLIFASLVISLATVLHLKQSTTSAEPPANLWVHTTTTFSPVLHCCSVKPRSPSSPYSPDRLQLSPRIYLRLSLLGSCPPSQAGSGASPLQVFFSSISQCLPMSQGLLLYTAFVYYSMIIFETWTVSLISDNIVAAHKDFGVKELRFLSQIHHLVTFKNLSYRVWLNEIVQVQQLVLDNHSTHLSCYYFYHFLNIFNPTVPDKRWMSNRWIKAWVKK